MAKIVVENMCACAKKRKSWSENIECTSLDEALQKAKAMCEQGNSKFCKRHSFACEKRGDEVVINVAKKSL